MLTPTAGQAAILDHMHLLGLQLADETGAEATLSLAYQLRDLLYEYRQARLSPLSLVDGAWQVVKLDAPASA